ncbi:hypothetical protein BASA50_009625 [Batrachochytrium salamandrivorans]|uniref:Heat shock factor-binding protein 1 n=1 Tax=Batrachochytrium salamandrivorans TaxID=1357716 RepID=A0ABQ8F0E0_9FUNG|nr:hypothetical protein BASA62_010106 [Batrachochytrium salamandrivorans]KAH6580026.1 hypothetical protein BASA60_003030 [Batrachochytrium salamandrivorans]KAH6581879.1 hypothetical protein BASA61_008767 [Batrachochytrium salamandrivorans]KAH6589922.1 hypothetical protein BASA50_009625 [Batrachochytrium salamandrivorans]KAH9253011.1 hypothetical protein BASA81_009016 [Batrachochytrium salamandrivorans]
MADAFEREDSLHQAQQQPVESSGLGHHTDMNSPSMQSQPELSRVGAVETPADLANHVEGVLKLLQAKFEDMSKNIITKMDDMGTRLDELERSLGSLVQDESIQNKTPTPTNTNMKSEN